MNWPPAFVQRKRVCWIICVYEPIVLLLSITRNPLARQPRTFSRRRHARLDDEDSSEPK